MNTNILSFKDSLNLLFSEPITEDGDLMSHLRTMSGPRHRSRIATKFRDLNEQFRYVNTIIQKAKNFGKISELTRTIKSVLSHKEFQDYMNKELNPKVFNRLYKELVGWSQSNLENDIEEDDEPPRPVGSNEEKVIKYDTKYGPQQITLKPTESVYDRYRKVIKIITDMDHRGLHRFFEGRVRDTLNQLNRYPNIDENQKKILAILYGIYGTPSGLYKNKNVKFEGVLDRIKRAKPAHVGDLNKFLQSKSSEMTGDVRKKLEQQVEKYKIELGFKMGKLALEVTQGSSQLEPILGEILYYLKPGLLDVEDGAGDLDYHIIRNILAYVLYIMKEAEKAADTNPELHKAHGRIRAWLHNDDEAGLLPGQKSKSKTQNGPIKSHSNMDNLRNLLVMPDNNEKADLRDRINSSFNRFKAGIYKIAGKSINDVFLSDYADDLVKKWERKELSRLQKKLAKIRDKKRPQR